MTLIVTFIASQDIVQGLIAIIDSAVDAAFINKASIELEKVLERLYISAVDKLAGHLGAKLGSLMEVCMRVLFLSMVHGNIRMYIDASIHTYLHHTYIHTQK